MACNGVGNKCLFNCDIIWNARKDEIGSINYDETKQELEINGVITIPDSGHRHHAYYQIFDWFTDSKKIPQSVEVDKVKYSNTQIEDWLSSANLKKPELHSVYCNIYNLNADEEGRLFDELNADQKRFQQQWKYVLIGIRIRSESLYIKFCRLVVFLTLMKLRCLKHTVKGIKETLYQFYARSSSSFHMENI